MRPALIGLLLAFSLPLHAAAPPQNAMLQLSVSGSIDIGPDGRVVEHKLNRGLSPAIEKMVANNIARWRFEPIIENGKPVIASTTLNLTLKAVPVDVENMQLRIENVWFGSPTANNNDITAPRYPMRALKNGVGASVMLVIRLDDQGNVIAAHPYQTSLNKRLPDARAAKWRKTFEDASIAAVMEWKYTPGESIGGVTLGSTAMVPFSYTISDSGRGVGPWQAYVPGPISPAPWVDESALANINTAELKQGDSVGLGSRFRLTTKVQGEFL